LGLLAVEYCFESIGIMKKNGKKGAVCPRPQESLNFVACDLERLTLSKTQRYDVHKDVDGLLFNLHGNILKMVPGAVSASQHLLNVDGTRVIKDQAVLELYGLAASF